MSSAVLPMKPCCLHPICKQLTLPTVLPIEPLCIVGFRSCAPIFLYVTLIRQGTGKKKKERFYPKIPVGWVLFVFIIGRSPSVTGRTNEMNRNTIDVLCFEPLWFCVVCGKEEYWLYPLHIARWAFMPTAIVSSPFIKKQNYVRMVGYSFCLRSVYDRRKSTVRTADTSRTEG